MNLLSKQRPSSVLGLTFDGNRLEGVVVRRSGSLQAKESVTATLALSPLGGDPLLVGREIRNHLDQAGIREKKCVVCIPSSWVLTLQTQVPELPEADVESFLQLEAERGFTSGHENLFVVNSLAKTAGGEQYATLVAIQRNHLETLEKALRAAQLKPLSFVLGMAALEAGGKEGLPNGLIIAVGSNSVEMSGTAGGGIVTLRSLDGAIETTGPQKRIDSDLIAREIRITLGQLPAALASELKSVKVFVRGDLARQFIGDFGSRIQNMGLRLETMDRASAAEFSTALPAEIALSPALAAAANYVRAVDSGPELLPPKVSQFQEWMGKRAITKKLGWAGLSGAAVVLIIIGLFAFQQVQITNLEHQKSELLDKTRPVHAALAEVNRYKPWYDSSYRALNILKTLSQAFPLNGREVYAKSMRIANLTDVQVAGVASDRRSISAVVDTLAKTNVVRTGTVTTPVLQGPAGQLQYTLNFQWEGDGSGN